MLEKIILGGYTSRRNKGIAEISLDPEKKALLNYNLIYEIEKPTYLMADQDGIYSCMQDQDGSGMCVINDGKLQAKSVKAGASPCHISKDLKKPYFYVSYYHQGELAVIKRTKEGLEEIYRLKHQGHSIHPNQDKAHIHFAMISERDDLLYVCDLGMDRVFAYQVADNGELVEEICFETPAGFGPRHLVFHPAKPFIYVVGELSNQVLVLRKTEKATLVQQQVISLLPEDYHGESAAAAIRISRDGKFVYASNRGHDSITVYQVQMDGSLKLVEHVLTYGQNPRDFNFNQDEKFMIVAHQASDHLTLFSRNAITGNLILCQKDVYAPECVCVCIPMNQED